MSKKYELLKDNYVMHMGVTLYRIKALKDFSDVKAGDIGGYVEKESNLSHEDNCWVYDDARVFENARIYDNATIHNNAKIFGNAEIFGNAIVNGNAKIYNCAEIFKNAIISKGRIIGKISMPYKDIFIYQCEYRTLTAILTEDNEILYSIGCQDNMTEEEFINLIHNTNGGLEEHPHRNEYLRLIKIIKIYFEEVQNG